jgi:4-amino-4-deoxy-L-arabinose transferase-like glycosyltransferase
MKSEAFSISKYLPVLFLVIFLSFFAHLGNLPLFDADEGAYSEVTREMLVNNDFTLALLNDIPFFHKPPLFFWAQAASIKILGLNEFGLRLPSAIAAFFWATTIFLFTRRFFDTRSAWYATLFMASSLLVTIIGRAATPEAMINLFLTLTLLNIYRFYHSGNKRHIYWSFMFAALGVLTKGSISMLIPIAVSLAFFTLKRKKKDFLELILNPVGLIVFGLIVIPWYLAEFMLYGEAFLSDLFLLPKAGTNNSNFIGSSLPYYSYPALLLIGLLPNTAFFLKALSQIKKLLSEDLIKFMVIWFLIAILFLPLSQPKSPFSLVYSFPPLFIIMARVTESFRHSFNLLIWPLLLTAFFCLVPDLAPYIMGSIKNEFARIAVAEGLVYFDAYYRITLGAILLLLTALPFINPAPPATKYAIVGLLFVSMTHFLVLPILGNTLQQPIKSAATLTKKEKYKVVTWRNQPPSFNLYAEMLTEHRAPESGDIILTKTVCLGNKAQFETLYEKHGIILARILEKGKDSSCTDVTPDQ